MSLAGCKFIYNLLPVTICQLIMAGQKSQTLMDKASTLELLQKTLFVAGAIALGIAVLIIRRQYRKQQQAMGMIREIRERLCERELILDDINSEKEWLVEEVHHRVKNNLQMAISLLNTQYAFLTNSEAKVALRSMQHRIFAISLVYQKLYQEDALSTIDIPVYISELLRYLQDEYRVGANIKFSVKTVPLRLDVTLAIPFALIVNEALSNAIMHAFNGLPGGDVEIILQSKDQRYYTLQIGDNGVGLPADFDINAGTSLGLLLMTGLSRQMKSLLDMKHEGGVIVMLQFENSGRFLPRLKDPKH